METVKYEFFECDNPNCQLRFPGSVDFSKQRRCPVCRSSVHTAAELLTNPKIEKARDIQSDWIIVAILDNIRSAWNVGSIFRTADGMGIKRLYLCGITPTPDDSKVQKTSLGGETSIAWEKCNNSTQLVNKLKELGYLIWVIEDAPHASSLYQANFQDKESPVALVIGNEVCGVDPGIIEQSDKILSIPMLGKKTSYNVAVAFGIAASFLVYCHKEVQESVNIFPKT
jgi:tRNA G18 (ribose-2'-O)-methylase SpoU